MRVGDNGQAGTATKDISMDDLFALTQSPTRSKSSTTAITDPQEVLSEATFFGLLPNQYPATSCSQIDPTGTAQWSPYPPFRFGVEFWDLDNLKEKQRLHSQTIWYAGSLFNVYVQMVKKKGQPQLGIYLHRQSSIDPIPPFSSPSPTFTDIGRQHTRGPSLPSNNPIPNSPPPTAPASPGPLHYSPSIHPPIRSTTPLSRVPTSSSLPSPSSFPRSAAPWAHGPTLPSSPFTLPGISPDQPYRDPRASITAYFTICCASPTGNAQTRFSSAPDVFKVSQSWGWKSGSLRGEEATTENILGSSKGTLGDDKGSGSDLSSSLRATVILGLV